MSESIRGRPKIALTLSKNTSLTGVPLCPACGQEMPDQPKFCGHCGHAAGAPVPPPAAGSGHTPPAVVYTKRIQNQGRGSFLDGVLRVVIVIVILIAASLAFLYVRDQYQKGEGRPEMITPTNAPAFAATCRGLAADVLAPLDAAVPATDQALLSLRGRARTAAAQPDTAALGRLVLDFCDRLDAAARQRGQLKQEEITVLNRPAPTLSPDPAEQKRVREFQYSELGRRWREAAAAQREPLNRLLAEVEKEERAVAAPRRIHYPSAWDRLRGFFRGKQDGRE